MSNHYNELKQELIRERMIEEHMGLGFTEDDACAIVDSLIINNPDLLTDGD